ncbi:MAG: YihY/virulence factor BrkB family protein [Acidobacteria bacterium]|nr:YihY/virulence factor BrkB family protein [Acidobacteriota bacterium]
MPFGEWLKRVWKSAHADGCDDLAAQLSYFFLMALFPFFIVLAAIVAYLPFTVLWAHVLTWITEYFPESIRPHIFKTVSSLTRNRIGLLSFGLATSIWIATRGVVSLMDALNHAYGVPETRKFWKRRVLSCGVMLVFAFAFLTAFGLLTYGDRLGHWLAARTSLGTTFIMVWHLFRWTISLVLLNFAVEFANHVLPNVRRPWRWYTPGSVFVVIVWFPATMAFNAFVSHFGSSESAYGALGTFFVLMFWIWITNFILLVGAEMDSEFEKASGELRSRDKPTRARIAS